MKHDGVPKREGFSFMAMLARDFLVVLLSSLSSSSLEEASLS
jgi:hypothetical protein